MKISRWLCLTVLALSAGAWAQVTTTSVTGETTASTSSLAAEAPMPPSEFTPCEPFPKGNLSAADLAALVPDNSPGRVFVRWRTETQEDNYGFNVYRASKPEGPYTKINQAIVPGEGSTNIPKDYCYVDKPLPRGREFYYSIESVSNQGVSETIAETKGTKVKVKTVAEEREWLRKKALGGDTKVTSAPAAKRTPPPAPQKPVIISATPQAGATQTTSPLD